MYAVNDKLQFSNHKSWWNLIWFATFHFVLLHALWRSEIFMHSLCNLSEKHDCPNTWLSQFHFKLIVFLIKLKHLSLSHIAASDQIQCTSLDLATQCRVLFQKGIHKSSLELKEQSANSTTRKHAKSTSLPFGIMTLQILENWSVPAKRILLAISNH